MDRETGLNFIFDHFIVIFKHDNRRTRERGGATTSYKGRGGL